MTTEIQKLQNELKECFELTIKELKETIVEKDKIIVVLKEELKNLETYKPGLFGVSSNGEKWPNPKEVYANNMCINLLED